jgi:hypothetical protein
VKKSEGRRLYKALVDTREEEVGRVANLNKNECSR